VNPIVHAFSERAYLYDKNRWDYSTEAIEKIYNTTGLNKNSTIAEIGSGTGILTKHFM
jgi:16S rRNA A1518/A1519 N6-dimethyltransferase RsmA/KsgA/DIM1 with predicted DNA glycosylase/AP lyase activity